MAEAFLLLGAFGASVVEGYSVLTSGVQHEENETTRDEKSSSSLLVVVPSVLYASTALPLTVIGAAPGPSLCASFPLSPSLQAMESSFSSSSSSRRETDARGTNRQLDESTTHGRRIPDPIVVPPKPTTTTPPLNNNSKTRVRDAKDALSANRRAEMVQRAREENQRVLKMARQNNNKQTKAAPPAKPANGFTIGGKWISTLDGRPLPTTLAEAMRRTRFLLVGASIVAAIASYQQDRIETERVRTQEEFQRQRDGKSLSAIQSLLQNKQQQQQQQQGTVVRLFTSTDELVHYTSSEGVAVVPVLVPGFSGGGEIADMPVFWNAGETTTEWMETPLTNQWLFPAGGQSILLMESDVTLSLPTYFDRQPATNATTNGGSAALSKTLLLSRALAAAAQQKGVLQDDASVVHVVVGTGPTRFQLPANTTYMDAKQVLASEIEARVEKMHEGWIQTQQQQQQQHDTVSPEEQDERKLPLSTAGVGERVLAFVELVGMRIRLGSERAARTTLEVVQERLFPTRTLHVLSDQRAFVQYLRGALKDWRIVWYDSNNASDVELYRIAMNEPVLSVICCCEQDETSLVFLSEVTDSPSSILVVLDHEYTKTSLEPIVQDRSAYLSALSVREVHRALFTAVREELEQNGTTNR